MHKKQLLLATGALLLSATTLAEAAGITALVGGRLIDGFGGTPIDHSVILIEGERIKAVGTEDSLPIPAGATVISTGGHDGAAGTLGRPRSYRPPGSHRLRSLGQNLRDQPTARQGNHAGRGPPTVDGRHHQRTRSRRAARAHHHGARSHQPRRDPGSHTLRGRPLHPTRAVSRHRVFALGSQRRQRCPCKRWASWPPPASTSSSSSTRT